MTSPDVQLELRPPRWARAWVVGFPAAMAVVALGDLVPLRGDPSFGLRLFICGFAAVLGWRLFRLAAIGTADGRLLLRNHWRDRTVLRDDIAAVGVTGVGGSPSRSVHLRLRDGSVVRLDVTEAPPLGPAGRRQQRQADAVRAWVADEPPPL